MDNDDMMRPGHYTSPKFDFIFVVKPNGWGLWIDTHRRTPQSQEYPPDEAQEIIESEGLQWVGDGK